MTPRRRIVAGLAALTLGLAGALAIATPAAAVGCDVSSYGNGASDGTLVHALGEANAGNCPSGVTFSITGTVPTVAEALPAITGTVAVFGPGEADLTIQGLNNTFLVNAGGSLTMSGLTIEADTIGINATGAGVVVDLTSVTVQGATGDGIHVENGTFTGTDVRAVNNGGNGISFLGIDSADTLYLAESDSGLNGADGLDLQTAGSETTINDLFLELNGGLGLDARVSGGDFDGTDIVASSTVGSDGIRFAAGNDADVDLNGGHSVESAGYGYNFDIEDASLNADAIEAFDNESAGVNVETFGEDSYVGISNAKSYQNHNEGFILSATQDSEIELLSSRSYENGDGDCGCLGSGVNVSSIESDVTIDDTEIDHNESLNGGGVFAILTDGDLDITNSNIHNNVAYYSPFGFSGHGGGIYTEVEGSGADLNVHDTMIEQNWAATAGAGVKIQTLGIEADEVGDVEFVRSTIRDNLVLDFASGYGGGIVLVDFYAHEDGSPVLVIDSSTISGNEAATYGGLYAYKSTTTEATGTVQVVNSTISGNEGTRGAGIFFGAGASGNNAFLVLQHSTVADNTDPENDVGGVLIDDASLDMSHTILAGNGTDLVLDEADLFAEWNIVQNPETTSGLDDPADHNRTGIDPKLGPLANNGGPTETHFLLEGSPAIDTGDPAIFNPPEFDQRGSARIVRIIDIGAVEVPATLPATGGDLNPAIPVGAALLLLAGAALVVIRRRAA